MNIPKVLILRLALATLAGMPLIAILVDRFSEEVDLATIIVGYQPLYIQLGVGAALGLAAGFSARWLIGRPFMKPVSTKYANLLGQFQLTWSEVLFVSFCAGVGEEILFRGAIQPFLGIVLTAIVFVAIHGYLNPRDLKMSIYGLLMTVFIGLIGFAADWAGLISAMMAHTIIDVILLQNLQQTANDMPEESRTPGLLQGNDEDEI